MKSNPKNVNGMLVDPVSNCNDFARTDAELEAWLMFCIMVAGHDAEQTTKKLQSFLSNMVEFNESRATRDLPLYTPFTYLRFLRNHDVLDMQMRHNRIGCYINYGKAFRFIVEQDLTGAKLRELSLLDLMKIPSVGLKTASFFIMSTRENVRMAALDTHVLKFMRKSAELGLTARFLLDEDLTVANIPKATPSSPELYAKLERVFLRMADAAGMTPVDFDFQIWKSYARAVNKKKKGVVK